MENIEFSLSPAAGGDEISPLAASLLEIARTYFSPEEYAPLRCAGLICLFFEQLLEAAPTRCISEKERQSSANRAQRIRTISAYIDRHYSEKLLLTDLARELGLTMGYLSAFFKSAFGLSFQSYVRKLRCEKARQLLLCTDLSLLDISLACGFSDLKYFNQGFAQQFGCSPRQYRLDAQRDSHTPRQDFTFTTQEFLSPSASRDVLEKYLSPPPRIPG